MSVLDGPGEGTWSVFAAKVVAERDAAVARCETLRELADVAALEQGLAQRRMMEAQRERDEARAELASARAEIEALKYPRAYLPPGEERSLALSAIMISQAETEIRALKAEVERLRLERDEARAEVAVLRQRAEADCTALRDELQSATICGVEIAKVLSTTAKTVGRLRAAMLDESSALVRAHDDGQCNALDVAARLRDQAKDAR